VSVIISKGKAKAPLSVSLVERKMSVTISSSISDLYKINSYENHSKITLQC